jgi:streptogramin lyase
MVIRKGTNHRIVWITVWLLGLSAIVMAQEVAVSRGYRVPNANFYLYAITPGPDGALWFTEYNTNQIGRITTAGAITEYAIPTVNAGPYGITAGPDGALWFTEITSGTIGRITTAGVITEYPLPDFLPEPSSITSGPDGALWFISNGCNIGRITTTGVTTEPYGTECGSGPNAITAGPDGALWFTDYGYNEIKRITTAGAVTFYPIPTANSLPNAITAGPDGALWFTEELGGKIGRITTSGVITEYPLPTPGSQPAAITAGPDGALWFNGGVEGIGRITTAGVITSYPGPASASLATAITTGPDGELWLTDSEANRISEVFFLTGTLSVTPTSGGYGDSIGFTGSGFAPHETVLIYRSGVGSAILAKGTADASGSFTAEAQVPQSAVGSRLFVAKGQTSGELGAANFSILPRLMLQPASGAAGSTVTAWGTGFRPMEKLWITWADPNTLLGATSADVDGTFDASAAATFTVPSGAPPGTNKVSAGGNLVIVKASASFTVQ